MKLFKGVFIALICMIGVTAFGSTTEPDQKLSTTIDQAYHSPEFVVNAANFDFAITVATVAIANEVFFGEVAKGTNFNHVAILTDVGWKSWRSMASASIYKEKLQPDFNIEFVHRINKRNAFYENRGDC